MSMEMKLNTVRVYFKIQDNTVVILWSKNHVQICDGQHKWQVSY